MTKNTLSAKPPKTSLVLPVDLTNICKTFMRRYGQTVNEERSMPAVQDGLKPVHRRILWAMHELGCTPDKKPIKSARIVGDVLGKYHPHGDEAAYGALVSLVNQPAPLVYGEGNWGTIFRDPPAAMRYTNAKLTPLGASLFDPYYAPAMKLLPNYDGTCKEPLLLMAPIPVLLLNYSMGIGVGAVSNFMPFTLESVVKLTSIAIKLHAAGKKVSAKTCAKTLQFTSWGGGVVEGQEDEVLKYMETGNGSIMMSSPYTCPPKEPHHMIFTEFAPVDIVKKMARIAEMDGVVEILPLTSIENGDRYDIILKRLAPELLNPLKKKIAKELECRVNLCANLTLRRLHEGKKQVKNIHYNVPEILWHWVNWRIACDKVATAAAVTRNDAEIARLKLLVFAVLNRDKILNLLSQRVPNAELNERLAKLLDISLEDAKTILDLKVRQLNALEKDELSAKIKELTEYGKTLKVRLTAPHESLIAGAKSVLQ